MIKNIYFSIVLFIVTVIGASAQISFDSSSPFKYLKGKDASTIPANWMTSSYIPTGWSDGYMPFRYGPVGAGGTLLNDMQNSYTTVYLLSTFNAQNITSLKNVNFSTTYDDGFVVWINGEEVFSVNAPDDRAYNSGATALGDPTVLKFYQLPAHDIELKEGENLIAIQGFNTSPTSSDFYFDFKINAELPLPQTTDTVKVVFSKPNGFYTSPFDLKMDVPDPSYTFVYTIDGSNPQSSSTVLNGGISKTINIDPTNITGRPMTPCYIVRASLIKDGLAPSFPLTQTYIFLDQVMNQTYPGGNWPTGPINNQPIDLDMDQNITKGPIYAGLMKDAMTDIPSISVVTELSDLFDPTTGIYVNAARHGEVYERFSSVELINPSGVPGFNINAGLRIRGGYSRHENFPKHAFRLFFREEYGAPKLTFPLFENEGVGEFDKIDLRCEQNYSWAHPGDNRDRNTGVREVFSRDTQRDMGQPYTRSRYYHLYLNGMYWGLYQTQERAEARYAADYLGGSKEDYDVVKVSTEIDGIEATDGNLNSWEKIYNMCTKGFVNNADYFALEGKDQYGIPKKGGEVIVNIDNLIDYMQLIFYTGNYDAPVSAFKNNQGPNNFYAIDKRDDRSSGFLFFAHDSEHSMLIGPENQGIGIQENRVTILGMNAFIFARFQPQWLHFKLSANKEYRQRFADRAYKNFFNNGVFTPDVVHARFQVRAEQIKKAIIGESARWGDSKLTDPPYTYTFEDWNREINDIYARYFPFRTDIVINQMKAASLYPTFSPPVFTKDNFVLDQGIYPVTGSYVVTISGADGQIYYTLNGTDPRLIGDQINNSAILIATGGIVNLKGTAFINARIKNGDQWSALASVKLMNPIEDYSHLKVTELHYHPTDSLVGIDIISGKSFEFIEFKNTGDKPINLAGLSFTSSIEYQFKESDILSPNQFYVLASKPKWFYERHFMVPTGNFNKNFSNSGEQVVISNATGSPIIDFTYLDYSPWSTAPDGDGPSLSTILSNPIGNPADASYWTASSVYDGTPFADDPGILDTIDDFTVADNSLAVFPNPTKGKLYLKAGDAKADIQVEIYSLSGSLIYNSSVVGNSVIDLGGLNIFPGIYMVKTKCNDQNLVNKVVYQP